MAVWRTRARRAARLVKQGQVEQNIDVQRTLRFRQNTEMASSGQARHFIKPLLTCIACTRLFCCALLLRLFALGLFSRRSISCGGCSCCCGIGRGVGICSTVKIGTCSLDQNAATVAKGLTFRGRGAFGYHQHHRFLPSLALLLDPKGPWRNHRLAAQV